MNLKTLCEGIALPKEIQDKVLAYSQSSAFGAAKNIIGGLKSMETEAATRAALKQILGEDEGQIKMLACMLVCAAEQHAWYQEHAIPDSIFWATMRCFTRFIAECEASTKSLAFDREWWTPRQISGTLFRIGELEYEMLRENGAAVIGMHIPSDCDLSSQNCDRSIAQANRFFATHFPEFSGVDYICNSWLLAPELSALLPENSRILAFQKRFRIQKVDYSETEYIEWVFKTKERFVAGFPEQSTLQKNMKKHLLDGGKIGSGSGVLKR